MRTSKRDKTVVLQPFFISPKSDKKHRKQCTGMDFSISKQIDLIISDPVRCYNDTYSRENGYGPAYIDNPIKPGW